MIFQRKSNTRGLLETSWIVSRRTFSNNQYWDPRYMNFGDLEVINDDILQPNQLVPNHEHKNMEILGYLVDGPATHTDSLGNNCLVDSDDIQFMSSGSSIWHTEGNKNNYPIRYIQLWIKPSVENTEPHWEKKLFKREDRYNTWCHIAGSSGIILKQDSEIYSGIFDKDTELSLSRDRKYYCYIVSGCGNINCMIYEEGDGFALIEEDFLKLSPSDKTEVIVFDLSNL